MPLRILAIAYIQGPIIIGRWLADWLALWHIEEPWNKVRTTANLRWDRLSLSATP